MKELHGTASAQVSAPEAECFVLLADVEGYPRWYPEAVRRVEVVERGSDGLAAKAHAQLHVAYGPLTRDFNLLLAIETERPARVALTRIPHHASDSEQFDVSWKIAPGLIAVELSASLSVPRMLPVGGIGESIASGFVTAAAHALASRSR